MKQKEMCRTTTFSFHSSNILNNTSVLYTVYCILSAVNGLSHLTTTSNGQARLT